MPAVNTNHSANFLHMALGSKTGPIGELSGFKQVFLKQLTL